jgi:hypothetical protein
MTDLVFVAQVIETAAKNQKPNLGMLLSAAQSVRETEFRLEAIEAIIGTLARKAGFTVDDVGLPSLVIGQSANHSTAARRQMTRNVARRILDGK